MSTTHIIKRSASGRLASRLQLSICGAAILTALASLQSPASASELASRFKAYAKGSAVTVDHRAWDQLLKSYVKASPDGLNRVDYAGFKARGHAELKTYISNLTATNVVALDRPEQFAFWANLYNAKTIDVVLDAYPVKSIKDISLGGGLVAAFTGGPWKAKVTSVDGIDLSLDDIEHQILRPIFRDPRVHYAVNCASVGCPNLSQDAYTGAKLEVSLDAAARAFVNHPRGFRVDGDGVVASSIYNWFVADFGGSPDGVVKHAIRYSDPQLKASLQKFGEISDYAYDWSLNDIAR